VAVQHKTKTVLGIDGKAVDEMRGVTCAQTGFIVVEQVLRQRRYTAGVVDTNRRRVMDCGRLDERRSEQGRSNGLFRRIHILLEQLRREDERIAHVVESECRNIGGKTVSRVDFHAKQIADRIVVFSAVQPARRHTSGLRFQQRILTREFAFDPAGDRLRRFVLRMRYARGRHLAELEFFDHALPCFTIHFESVGRVQTGQIKIARFDGGIVTGAAVLLYKCKHIARRGLKRKADKDGPSRM